MQNGMQRQLEIFRKGLLGQRESFPLSPEALEEAARAVLPPEAYDYVAGGAGSESTMRANVGAFERYRLVPRMLRNVSERDLSIELLGHRYPAPVFIGPVGVQKILHSEGELAIAQAAATLGIPFMLSTVSSYPIEQVAQVAGDAPRWFQLYWSRDPNVAASFVRRAEAAGYQAIVITVDTCLLAWRDRDLSHAYLPFMQGEGLANYFTDPAFRAALAQPPEQDPGTAIMHFAQIFGNPALTWDDLGFIRQHTRLPVLLKGILHPDDAREAVRRGVDGIIVSNHGGRQVDGAIAALDALPKVVEAVEGRIPVLFDGGIRRAADVLKALALGAKAVLLARPVMWALAIGGAEGVQTYLRNFLAELDLSLGLLGCRSVAEVNRQMLAD
uniref:Lactate 2-monooxygenase n=1 Tax=uncultured prokaryote TaxID=198431 RepID=H5SJW6_9ZZZZ|nr:lactate 2-monooxygenase [uncultured prokaryote]